MALNIKTLGTRAISALVFVLVLLGCVLWNYYSFTLFFFLVSMLGLNEFYKLAKPFGAEPFRISGFLAGALLYISFIQFINDLHYIVAILPFAILLGALFSKNENPVQNALFTIAGIIYAVLPFALLNTIVFRSHAELETAQYFPEVMIGIILLIWTNDTLAYLGGSLFGKHKMIERISPGKTWEGTIFGIIATFGLSFYISTFISGGSALWMVLGILVPVLATLGDLVESMLKRQAGVKDTGNIMPGHGGILDRFDSLIFVSPFAFAAIKLLQLY